MTDSNASIGVFDSGIGGLTVVRALREELPQENIVYLGDTARVPYGNKTAETVTRFSLEDCRFLQGQGVKLIVAACNTASALAMPALLREIPVPILGMIETGAAAAAGRTVSGRVGVIGTAATIASGAYAEALTRLRPGGRTYSKACPLLVPLVEEGWAGHAVTEAVLREYLPEILGENIDTLVLGCTHYPLLKEAIARVAGPTVALVDSAQASAQAVRRYLTRSAGLNPGPGSGRLTVCVTDLPARVGEFTARFLGIPELPVEKVTF
ncbi:MAG: glutamate racemase [Verrucomicrobiae bacterium]|nr:glutamate racemase [Verrucomicrobiae bacterium]